LSGCMFYPVLSPLHRFDGRRERDGPGAPPTKSCLDWDASLLYPRSPHHNSAQSCSDRHPFVAGALGVLEWRFVDFEVGRSARGGVVALDA
jgi:hypothetical protein